MCPLLSSYGSTTDKTTCAIASDAFPIHSNGGDLRLPLALAAFYSACGFVLSCSPRSPISNLSTQRQIGQKNSKLSWVHLPIPKSAWLMNTLMFGVGVLMCGYNFVITGLSSHHRNLTHQRGRDLYAEVLSKQHTQEWLDQAPTPELLAMVKLGWCDLLNVFRWCCAGLASYIILVGMIVFLVLFYSIPNQLFLIEHLCRIFPDHLPEKDLPPSILNDLRMLRKIGWPRKLKGSHYSAFKKTWMMTMIGHAQSILLLLGATSFAVPPFFLFIVPWNNAFAGRSSDHQIQFILAYTITVAFLTAFWITGLSATLTYDDIFRVFPGLVTLNPMRKFRVRRLLIRSWASAAVSSANLQVQNSSFPQSRPLWRSHRLRPAKHVLSAQRASFDPNPASLPRQPAQQAKRAEQTLTMATLTTAAPTHSLSPPRPSLGWITRTLKLQQQDLSQFQCIRTLSTLRPIRLRRTAF